MAYSFAWDESSPAGGSNISLGDDRIREMKQTVRQALDDEHTSLTAAPSGPLMHAWVVVAKSTGSPYTVLSSDHIILVTTGSSADYTVVLPTAVGITGKPYKIKKADSGTKTVIIDANGSETIDGAATFVLSNQNDFVDLISDGANWHVVSTNTNLDWDSIWGASGDAVHSHASDAEGGTMSGQIAQIVNVETGAAASGTTQIPFDDTIPQNTEGDEYMTLAITPKDVNNKLKIDVVLNFTMSSVLGAAACLFQDSTGNALAVGWNTSAGILYPMQIVFSHYMLAGTVSATTFKVRAGPSGGASTLIFNGATGLARRYGGVLASSITITEITP